MIEPTVEQTVEILQGLKSRFEEHHGVKYSAGALHGRGRAVGASSSMTAICPTRRST